MNTNFQLRNIGSKEMYLFYGLLKYCWHRPFYMVKTSGVWKTIHIISSVPLVINKWLKIMILLQRIKAINSLFRRIGQQYYSGIYVWILLPLSSPENQFLNLLPNICKAWFTFLGGFSKHWFIWGEKYWNKYRSIWRIKIASSHTLHPFSSVLIFFYHFITIQKP